MSSAGFAIDPDAFLKGLGTAAANMNGVRLESKRIVLREWRIGDSDAMHRLMGNPEVTRFLSWGPLTREDSIRRLDGFVRDQDCRDRKSSFRRWLRNSSLAIRLRRDSRGLKASSLSTSVSDGDSGFARIRFYFAIELKASGKVIGETGFERIPDAGEERSGEIGYFLESEFWGKGYATEAALLGIEFAFATLGACRIHAACDVRNSASERVMQKCGLRPVAKRDPARPVHYEITRGQWQKSR